MSNITVSFCISSYNRKEMTCELVSQILSCPNPRIEVVVSDDASTDGTLDALQQTFHDDRLKCFSTNKRSGAVMNWYYSLEKGTGKWLFQIIDRDWIRTDLIDKLVMTLESFEKTNIAFAVAGEAFSDTSDYQIIPEGLDTLKEFALRQSHPTGQILRKAYWEIIENRRDFFENEAYGIYPHGYLYAILGSECKGAYIHFDICDKEHYNERVMKTVSRVYQNRTGKAEWFLPESRYSLLELACEHLDLILEPSYHQEFILNLYSRLFFSVTAEWNNICHNDIIKLRYNRPDLTTNALELLSNGFRYIYQFRQYLQNCQYPWADDIFYAALCRIEQSLLDWLIPWTNERRTDA